MPVAAHATKAATGMANCRFCQKSNSVERTFTKCGCCQYSTMVAPATTAPATNASAAMASSSLAMPSSTRRRRQISAAATSGPR